jgi:hypothetical protein
MMPTKLPPADLLILGLQAVVVGTHLVRGSASKLGIAPYAVSGLLVLASRAAQP